MTIPAGISGIGHLALRCADLQAMEGFYCGLLGFRVVWRPGPEDLYLSSGRDNLALHRATNTMGETRLDHFGLVLESAEHVDQWANHLRAKGVVLAAEPRTHRDGARSFYVRDPEGNLVQFIHLAQGR